MKTLFHPHEERGGGDHGWLSTRYSFSFNDWYDPSKMGFGTLRVLNDDVIEEGEGFGTHGHKDMEIITIVMKGGVAHTDSMGNEYIVREGDVQVMSAGTGVRHAEQNASDTEPLELFQIWIEPKMKGVEPKYAQKNFNFQNVKDTLIELVGKDILPINQDAWISYGALDEMMSHTYQIHDANNGVYIFVIEGTLEVGGQLLERRDALGLWDIDNGALEILSKENATFLVMEVGM